ncbi:hypothetical protein JOC95_004021 [Bacillus tianshenii]|uniref:Lipoprotein n=1 Tax=Sutcliffiella tianshenii TaxID=1463404 RepID=A0ABS2P588_9BACI|nr:DUF6612 family protein [Bacillus tianshenii]MBM7622110.1 hypothetical protein [Bacillus tianshenii]
MRVLKMWMIGILAVLMLAACGNSTTGNGEDGNSNKEANNEADAQEQDDSENGSMTADDVLQKSIAAMSALKSYSMEMTSDQQITMAGEEPINMVTSTKTDMTLDPMAMYQVTSMEDAENMMEGMESESYFTEDGFFIFDQMAGQWFKMPDEFVSDLSSLSDMQADPSQQLEMLKGYSEEMKLTEEGDVYILNFSGSGEQYNDMISAFGNMMGEGMGGMMEEMMSMMSINQLDYELHIDKQTFYQTKIVMMMDMEMDIEGEKVSSIQNMDSTLSNFDEVGDIKVPQEVLDTAEEISLEDMQQMENTGQDGGV